MNIQNKNQEDTILNPQSLLQNGVFQDRQDTNSLPLVLAPNNRKINKGVLATIFIGIVLVIGGGLQLYKSYKIQKPSLVNDLVHENVSLLNLQFPNIQNSVVISQSKFPKNLNIYVDNDAKDLEYQQYFYIGGKKGYFIKYTSIHASSMVIANLTKRINESHSGSWKFINSEKNIFTLWLVGSTYQTRIYIQGNESNQQTKIQVQTIDK